MSTFTLKKLEAIIAERAASDDANSWTAKLVAGGLEKAGKKFGEEATETLIAALKQDDDAVVAESADMIYHWLVLLHLRGVALEDVLGELEKRTSRSGIEEKSSRKS